MHGCKTLGGLAQGWFEVPNAQPGQGGLYPIHNPRAFPHQAVALAVRPLGVLFGNRGHARHAAMAPFATQPPQEPALQQLGVEPVGFRAAMLPRYRDTRGMDHVRLYSTRRKPARQPEAVAASFEGSAIRVIVRPALTASSRQRCSRPSSRSGGLGSSFLRGWRSMPGSIPATSQLDWLISTTAMIVLSWSRASRDLLKSLGWVIGARHRLDAATKLPFPRRPPHSISLLEG